jgi:hypothetical protein
MLGRDEGPRPGLHAQLNVNRIYTTPNRRPNPT